MTPTFLHLRMGRGAHTVSRMKVEKTKKVPNLQKRDRVHFSKIAALVKSERAKKDISLRELALKTKLSHQQILRVERGICSVESALTVLKALGVSKTKRVEVVTGEMFKLAMAS